MAGGRPDELFLADSANGVVRAFDMRSGQLDERDIPVRSPRRVFSALWWPVDRLDECGVQRAHRHTCRLHEAGRANTIRSFARANNSEWRECHRLEVEVDFAGVLRALSDENLLLEATWMRRLSCECWRWTTRKRSRRRRSRTSLFRIATSHSTRRSQRKATCCWRASSDCRRAQNKWSSSALSERSPRSSRGTQSLQCPGGRCSSATVCSCTLAGLNTNGRCGSFALAPEASACSCDASSSGGAIRNVTRTRTWVWFPSGVSRTRLWWRGAPSKTFFRSTRCCNHFTSIVSPH